jgi:hypothetical protein
MKHRRDAYFCCYRAWISVFSQFLRPPNLFCQSKRHGDNTSQAFYFCPVLPSSTGGRRKRVGDQGQPFRVLIQFAPAAYIALAGHQEVDWSPELMGPILLR